jgi:hypothetical protein
MRVLGIFKDPRDSLPAMVSPYIDNGTLTDYLERHPEANRLRLVQDFIHYQSIDRKGKLIILHAAGRDCKRH